MNSNEYIAKTIIDLLKSGSSLVLASIVGQQGSSPRHNGTKMVIGADGKTYGTIGGGLIEAATIKESRQVLEVGQFKFMEFSLMGKDANSAGMICGGTALILLDFIIPSSENCELFGQWYQAIQSRYNFYYLTQILTTGNDTRVISRCLLLQGDKTIGTCTFSTQDMAYLKSELHNISTASVIPLQDTRLVVDPIRIPKILYIFGSGHVAIPTAHVAAMVGFHVTIIDDRAELANAARFPEASEIKLIKDWDQVFRNLEIGPDSFIVIMTRGHSFDRVVLEQALKTRAGYIGMISSRQKREAIYEALRANGVTEEQLNRVHSPIGLAIKAETPEEIAVSIVGELISERANQPG